MIEPFKYIIQPVAIERDDGGRVTREIPGEMVSVYNAEQAVEAITEFEQQLAVFVAEQNGSIPPMEVIEK
jgi:hypothetical protein